MNTENTSHGQTIQGLLTNVRSIPTRSGNPFVVCTVGKERCKLFGNAARYILANQHMLEDEEAVVYGHWELKTEREFVVAGFGKPGTQAGPDSKYMANGESEKPAMKLNEKYVVITVPKGVEPEQLKKIADAAEAAVRGIETQLPEGAVERSTVYVSDTKPTNEDEDVPF